MGHAGFDPFLAAMAVAALALSAPTPCAAADHGWTPTIAKVVRPAPTVSKAEHTLSALPLPPMPPMPIPKASVAASPLPPVATPAGAPGATEITTGAIDPGHATRMLSPADSARLLNDDNAKPDEDIVTGAVDGQVSGPGSDLARGYCVNIASAATDARIAWQRAKLADVEKEIAKRISLLDSKTAEYKAWVERREDFLKRASTALVKIYTQMEPDAAALQLVSMDEETAAALLMRLEPQNASGILNEMPPDKAARLAATIAGAARVPRAGSPPPAVAAAAAAAAAAGGGPPGPPGAGRPGAPPPARAGQPPGGRL